MKPIEICRSLLRLGVLTFTLVVPLLLAGACAENPAAPIASGASTELGIKTFPKKWVGVYEPAGSGRGPKVNSLIINKTTFSWGGCEDTSIRRIAESKNEFVFEVDPRAKCGWAGWIVRLYMPVTVSFITVDVYRTTSDLESKRYTAHYSFERVAR